MSHCPARTVCVCLNGKSLGIRQRYYEVKGRMELIACSTEYLRWFYFHGLIAPTLLCGPGLWNSVNIPLCLPTVPLSKYQRWVSLIGAPACLSITHLQCDTLKTAWTSDVKMEDPTRLPWEINVKITQQPSDIGDEWIEWLSVFEWN